VDRERLTRVFESRNLIRLVIGLPVGIFLAEVVAMLVVYFFDGAYWYTILIDAVITTTMMLPIIYFLSFRPLLNNISKRERAEAIMNFRLRLMQKKENSSLDDLLVFALDEIEALTGATVGFFHFLEADQKTMRLRAWSTNTVQNMCKADGKGSHYDLEMAGVWADCVRQLRPVVHNDYQNLPDRKGTPEGHAPILRELTVPILREGSVVAILGVGNKPKAFSPDDVELVSTLADFAWDTIEQKQAQETLRESEVKFRTLVDWTYDWEQWVDSEGNYVYNSPSCERITGYPPEEFVSDPALAGRIVHPEDRKLYKKHMQVIHDESAGINNVEFRILDQDGEVHWIDHICRPLFDNDGQYLGRRVSNRDITLRKLAEHELLDRNQKEYMLTQMIQTLKLEIARDLHDTIGQSIGFLRLKLDHLNETGPKNQAEMKTEISGLLNVANESYDLVRGTLDMLQSAGLDDLLTLFTHYASQIEERSSFKIHISSRGKSRPLSPNQVRQLFFVVREALSNIEKHAHAANVIIQMEWFDDHLVLQLSDDGCGFDPKDMPAGNHYGLKFMRERIESLNGNFSVSSTLNKGTVIKISLATIYQTEKPDQVSYYD